MLYNILIIFIFFSAHGRKSTPDPTHPIIPDFFELIAIYMHVITFCMNGKIGERKKKPSIKV